MLDAVEPPTEEDYKNGLRKKQFVMELDVNTWKVANVVQLLSLVF